MKYRETTAKLLKENKNVALYCDGIFSDTNILWFDKFKNVHPTLVIDNDPRKKGKTLFDIPIMPYTEAKKKYQDLYYYIQGSTYQYTIIGSLLDDGVKADHIINYVPVEKRKGCLISETSIGVSNNGCNICYETGFNYNKNNNKLLFQTLDVDQFNEQFGSFVKTGGFIQADGGDCRTICPLYKPGYYAIDPRIRLIGDYNTDHCELACIYCFLQELGMNRKPRLIDFHQWLEMLLKSDKISDSLVLHICPTEKTEDKDVEETLKVCEQNQERFETIHLFSCCYAYRKGMEPLLRAGLAKNYWSLDAGTEETWEKIKRRKGGFQRVLENVENYRAADAFEGASIVPKYSIVKGINDNEKDFEGFVEICHKFGAKYCAIQWDYADNDNTNEEDYKKIQKLYRTVTEGGLKTTYTSGSTTLSKALSKQAFYENGAY